MESTLQVPNLRASASLSLRKTSSSSDFVSLPRSRTSSFVGSYYADSVRRQRSDTFIHVQQETRRKSQTPSHHHNKVLPPSQLYLTHSPQLLPSKVDSDSETDDDEDEDKFVLNTDTDYSTETGALLEGVLIRRAVRPSIQRLHEEQERLSAKRTLLKDSKDSDAPPVRSEDLSKHESDEKDPVVPIGATVKEKLERNRGSYCPCVQPYHIGKDDHQATKSLPKFHFPKSFGHRQHHVSKTGLYDDGSSTVYPPPPNKDDKMEIDRYGFKKSSQWLTAHDHREFEKRYNVILERRWTKWLQLLEDNDWKLPDRQSKVRRYIRKGVPAQLRGRVWLHYSGAQAKMDANPGVYDKFVTKAGEMGEKNEFADIIERDLHRTFPENVNFEAQIDTGIEFANVDHVPAISALRRVLAAFSIYCPSVGYCQSLNYIVGMLLIFMKEEEAFWTLVTIVQNILPAGVYDITMEGSNLDQTVLMMLLWERMPHIWNKLSDKSFWESEADGVSMPTITLVTSHWFLTLFINILPTESVLRVWDCLFFEGANVLFRVALAIFKMSENVVLALDDPLEIFQVIQNVPKRMINCQLVMEVDICVTRQRVFFTRKIYHLCCT
ncbi:rab-GTPase-TBC domain-containing protein [Radiomyces spectabilis]|uniref:rab-GTPase-TBC domain-containing protein n=1 Tax=Radiomyces spectabilis TaxID=64574 RepID=UPI00221F2C9D|nr:rab-GTPase-TBC domain-containing protein [Radiomyces spectabilis]KAI8366106.1 rab-GTPase-TBC domain-containing protein [Radiomyces spectabilis]